MQCLQLWVKVCVFENRLMNNCYNRGYNVSTSISLILEQNCYIRANRLKSNILLYSTLMFLDCKVMLLSYDA